MRAQYREGTTLTEANCTYKLLTPLSLIYTGTTVYSTAFAQFCEVHATPEVPIQQDYVGAS